MREALDVLETLLEFRKDLDPPDTVWPKGTLDRCIFFAAVWRMDETHRLNFRHSSAPSSIGLEPPDTNSYYLEKASPTLYITIHNERQSFLPFVLDPILSSVPSPGRIGSGGSLNTPSIFR